MNELYNLFGGSDQLWNSIRAYATKAGRESTRTVLELYYVVKSPSTPALDKTLIIAALGYQLLPNDLMAKDKYGWLGLLDNGAALYLAYNRVKKRITPQIESQVNAILEKWFGNELLQTETHEDNPDKDDSSPLDGPSTITRQNTTREYDENEEVVID